MDSSSQEQSTNTAVNFAASAQPQTGFWQIARNHLQLLHQAPPIQLAPRDIPLPLSFNQERLWRLEQLHAGSSVHNILHSFQLTGVLDITALEQSLREITRRHEALRTTFPCINGQPTQVISTDAVVKIAEVDLRYLPPTARQAEIETYAIAQAEQPFDLSQGPLWRVALLRLAESEYVLLRTIHHIIFDGMSHSVFVRELGALYSALTKGTSSPLIDLPVQYADFAWTQRQWLQGENLALQLGYWQQHLHGTVPALELPTDYPRLPLPSYRGACESRQFSPQLTSQLKALSAQYGVSLFVTLLAAFNTVLYQHTGQEDQVICSPVAGRSRAEIRAMIGYFNNVVALRSNLSADPSFAELLSRVSRVFGESTPHQEVPLQLVSELPNLVQTPLTRAMFVLQNTPAPSLALSGLSVSSVYVDREIANFDLSLSISEKAGQLTAVFQYKTDLFCSETIAQLLARFEQLLEQLVINPEQRLSALPMFRKLTPISHGSVSEHRTDRHSAYMAPRNELEQQLTQIWEKVLGVHPIGIQDNFFELGGHSLSAVKLWSQIEQRFEKTLPLTTLLQAPTIETLAPLLHTTPSEVSTGDLVPLRSRGSKPPLFCIYGILLYRELVDHLDAEQPVYGVYVQEEVDILKMDQAAQQSSIFANVASVAARYLQAIRKLQPHGPYYLAGESFGGVVALEMAQQLQAAGEEVALVALLDSALPNARPHVPVTKRLKLHGQLLLKQGASYLLKAAQRKVRQLQQKRVGHSLKVQLQPDVSPTPNAQAAVLQDIRQAVRDRILTSYSPQAYSGQVLLFRAMERDPFEIGLSHDLGWGQFLAALQVFDIPGDHLGILKTPNVEIMADLLQAHINATLSTSSSITPLERVRKRVA